MKHDIKLIALDLDGTLFNEKKEVTEYNKQTILEAARAGVQTIASTGRPYTGLPFEALREIGAKYAITANGAAIYDLQEEKCIYSDVLSHELACELIELFQVLDLRIDLIADGQGYGEWRSYEDIGRLALSEHMKDYLRTTRKNVDSLVDFIRENPELKIEKVTLNFYPLPDGTYKEHDCVEKMLSARTDLSVVCGGYHNLEISSGTATKGSGLCVLAGLLGMELCQTMACGDSENDMDIMQTAGIGVAMGNAEDKVKAIADFVTKSNLEDGVAYAIRKLVLGEE